MFFNYHHTQLKNIIKAIKLQTKGLRTVTAVFSSSDETHNSFETQQASGAGHRSQYSPRANRGEKESKERKQNQTPKT